VIWLRTDLLPLSPAEQHSEGSQSPGAANRTAVLLRELQDMTSTNARVAELADVPQLVSLMTEFYAEAGFTLPIAAVEHAFEQLVGEPRLGQVWLLECEGQPAGFIVLTVSFSIEYGGFRGFVDDFFVRAQYRRRGLGAVALDEVRRACKARGVRALLVEVGPENETALRVYRRSGFADSGHLLLTLPLSAPVHLPPKKLLPRRARRSKGR